MAFSDKVKQYGSVEAALKASGYSKGSSGGWTHSGGGSSSSSSSRRDQDEDRDSERHSGGGTSSRRPSSSSYGGYDPNKDYSLAIYQAQKNGASQSYLNQLRQERQNKIDAQYGGRDPYRGSSNIMGGGSRGSYGGSNSSYGGSSSYGGGAYQTSGQKFNENSPGFWQSTESHAFQQGPGYVTGGWSKAPDGSIWLDKNTGVGAAETDMRRRPDLAGKTAISNGMTIFYDELGYAKSASKGVAGYRPHKDPYAANGPTEHLWTDQEMMTAEDLGRLQNVKDRLKRGELSAQEANRLANEIRRGYDYAIDTNGYVTSHSAAGTAAARRQQWGLGPGPTAEQVDLMSRVYPWGVRAHGVAPDYLERVHGIPRQPPAPTVDPDSWPNAYLEERRGNPVRWLPDRWVPDRGSASHGGSWAGDYSGGGAEEYLRELYRQKQAAEEARLRLDFDQRRADLLMQQNQLSALYDRRRNQAAAEHELERLRLAETGSAHGLNTGAFGQLALGQSMAYQNTLSDLGAQENADLAQSAQQLSRLEQTYRNALTQSAAANQSELMDKLYREYVRQSEAAARFQKEAWSQQRWQQERWDRNARWQQERRDNLSRRAQDRQDDWDRWAYQAAEKRWAAQEKALADRARILASYGDFSGYAELGYSDDELAAMKAGWREKHPPKRGSSRRRGGSYHNGSLSSSQVKKMQRKLGVRADGKWGSKSRSAAGNLGADAAWKKYYG